MSDTVDVLVIGAGIHGAGVAQVAAAAGYSVRLLEQYSEPAQGTSSRSSKLIHGGLRYLEGFHFGLVRESLRERALLLKNAPELVHLTPMHIPLYGHSQRGPLLIRAGLSLYAVLGGMRRENRFQQLPRSQWEQLDGLETTGLRAVFRYFEAQTDDAALTRAVLHSAQQLGAGILFDTCVTTVELSPEGGIAHYQSGGRSQSLSFRALVNAAGPWASEVLEKVSPAQSVPAVELVRGSHIVLPGALSAAYYVESPRDHRAVFALPWHGHTLVGTTEGLYQGDPGAVSAPQDEIDYLLETWRHYFTSSPGEKNVRILESFAGLRVLPSSQGLLSARSRETSLVVDRCSQPRLLSVLGGKLTTYRSTSERVIQRLAGSLPERVPRADTREIQL